MSAVILSACAFNSCMQMKSAFCWGTQSRNLLRTAERIQFRLAEMTRSLVRDVQDCYPIHACNLNHCLHSSPSCKTGEDGTQSTTRHAGFGLVLTVLSLCHL